MRLSEIGEKEIVNLTDGERFGLLSDADLLLDERYGKIRALLIEDFRGGRRLFGLGQKTEIEVPWSYVKKIGADMIIFETTDNL